MKYLTLFIFNSEIVTGNVIGKVYHNIHSEEYFLITHLLIISELLGFERSSLVVC